MGTTNENHSPSKGAFTIEEAVKWSGLSRTRIYNEIADGNLRAKKAGRRTIIIGASLQALLDGLPEAAIGPAKAA